MKSLLTFVAIAAVAFQASAATVTVGNTNDAVNGTTTSVANLIANQGSDGISLREALLAANNDPSATVISIPAATYSLTNAAYGELQVGANAGANITLSGAGAASTIIQQTLAGQRVINADYAQKGNVNVTISGLAIKGGIGNIYGGGGICAGWTNDALTVSNCVFASNKTTNNNQGGAISFSGGGSLNVTGCVFSNNLSDLLGGAIAYNNSVYAGSLTISASRFVNNAASNAAGCLGGAVYVGGVGSYHITTSAFTNNSVTGSASTNLQHGAAINLDAGMLTIDYCNVVGNQGGTGHGVFMAGGSTNTAVNNWWGASAAPGAVGTDDAQGTGVSSFAPFLVLALSNSAPYLTTIDMVGPYSSTLAAGFFTNSSGAPINSAQLPAFTNLPVAWTLTGVGFLTGQQTVTGPNATASAALDASISPGVASVVATTDHASATNNTIIARVALASSPASLSICETNYVAFAASSNAYPAAALQWQVSTNGGIIWRNISSATNSPLTIYATASLDGVQYRAVFTNLAGSAYSASAALTVYRDPITGQTTLGVAQNSTLQVSTANLLAVASDPAGLPLSLPSVKPLSTNGGSVSLASGVISYSPAPGFSGRDQFYYTIDNSVSCPAQGTVVVVVTVPGQPAYNTVNLSFDGDSRILNFTGVPGQTYYLQASGDVQGPYTNLTSLITADQYGDVFYVEDSSLSPDEFYRIKAAQ